MEYSDIGDANVNNCGKMVAASYIRMASTRSQARALRKYTNIDMVCSSELSDVVDEAPEPLISMDQLTMIKGMLGTKHIGQTEFAKILTDLFHHTNYTGLTQTQGTTLINTLSNYVSSTAPAQ